MKTSTLCLPCGYKDLHPTAMTCKPAVTWRPPSCGDLETSILRRPGDLHSAATRGPPSCDDLQTTILRRPYERHPYCSLDTPSLWRPKYSPRRRLRRPWNLTSASTRDICLLWRPGWNPPSCGDLVCRHLPPEATSVLLLPAIFRPPSCGDLDISPFPSLHASRPSLWLPGYLTLRRPEYFPLRRPGYPPTAATWIYPPTAATWIYPPTAATWIPSHCGELVSVDFSKVISQSPRCGNCLRRAPLLTAR